MSVLKYQSDDEVIRVLTEWGSHFFPPTVEKNKRNMNLIGDRCLVKSGEIVSIVGLTEAANELATAGQLELNPETRALTQVEKAAILEAHMHRDWLESKKVGTLESVQKLNAKNAETAKKDALARELKSLNSQIESEVGNFSVGHPSGHQDYSRTNSGKQTLGEVRDGYHRRTLENAKTCLSAVKAAKAKL